jgi:hypothetical protein
MDTDRNLLFAVLALQAGVTDIVSAEPCGRCAVQSGEPGGGGAGQPAHPRDPAEAVPGCCLSLPEQQV